MTRKANLPAFAAAAILTAFFVLPAVAQPRRGKTNVRKPAAKAAAEVQASTPPVPVPPKRNERPADAAAQNRNEPRAIKNVVSAYRYEFVQPDFIVSSIRIEHDDAGAGTIVFRKKGDDELITDPIRVSPKALARIEEALGAMNFLDSTENYQFEKDFSHLGNMKFARTRDGKTREVTFNYTSNKSAKVLMDEYRKIGNQFIWIFDIMLSRDNQPLEAPRLLDSLDSLVRRNEISDPHQMAPFLTELSNDERIPLIARNHAAKLVKQFEKEKAKEEKKRTDAGK